MCSQIERGPRGLHKSSEDIKAIPLTSTDLTSTEASTEATKNPCEREVSVEVPAEDVSREWKSAVARFQKHARIPASATARCRATLMRSKFADDIKSEVVEHLVPAAFREETKKQNLIPIGQPRVVELELEEDKPLRFKAVFEVLPPFEVAGYQEIKVAHEPVEVERRRGSEDDRQSARAELDLRQRGRGPRPGRWRLRLGGVQEHQPGRRRRAGGDERRAGGYRRREYAADVQRPTCAEPRRARRGAST